jgi:sulfur carrier protein
MLATSSLCHPGCLFLKKSAEIIPVEPDPDHAGARERSDQFQALRKFGALFLWEKLMKLTVNGEQLEHQGDGTVDALLEELEANKEHTALMINGNVISSSDWASTPLNENDDVEMLVFVGGG